jgi:hypothetical protein
MIFKKGDKVYDHAYGWGEVLDTFGRGNVEIIVKDGKAAFLSEATLSFTEYTLNGFSQERPKEPLPFNKGDVVYVCDSIGSDIWGTCVLMGIGAYNYGKPFRGSSSWQFLALENPLLFPDTRIYTKEDL